MLVCERIEEEFLMRYIYTPDCHMSKVRSFSVYKYELSNWVETKKILSKQSILKIGSARDYFDLGLGAIHAVIEIKTDEEPEHLTITDLGREPCTKVNGKPINKSNIKAGDEILIGNTKIIYNGIDKDTEIKPSSGYHKRDIKKGELGKPSKIREELEELEDAIEQDNRIMALVELSDLYGALKAVADDLGTNMDEVKVMQEATAAAFKSGSRK